MPRTSVTPLFVSRAGELFWPAVWDWLLYFPRALFLPAPPPAWAREARRPRR